MYCINVAKVSRPSWDGRGFEYRHHCKVSVDSIEQATDIVIQLRIAMPDPEYKIDVYREEKRSHHVFEG